MIVCTRRDARILVVLALVLDILRSDGWLAAPEADTADCGKCKENAGD